MLFDHCAECQSCCRIDEGYPPLEITLSKAESKRMDRLCIESTCDFLGSTGCTLGDDKPLGCQLYPLSYDPKTTHFFFDAACPLMPLYRQQLDDPASEATQHLSRMTHAVRALAKEDPSFLKQNFKVDSNYFDLQPLHSEQSRKKVKP
jgi:Fe-S-cluster containining protein